MRSHIYFFLFLLFISYNSSAQRTENVFKYSLLEPGGTARSIGGGGALGALGGDFSTLTNNPGGLGAYVKSEFHFSPNLGWKHYNNTLFDTEESSDWVSFRIGSMGAVFTDVNTNTDAKVVAKNLAIGYSTLKNYNNNFYYEGTGQGTIGRRLESQFQNNFNAFSPFFEELAITNGLFEDTNGDLLVGRDADGIFIDTSRTAGALFRINPDSAIVEKSQWIKTKGASSEISIAGALNLENKIYLGATLGVPIIKDEIESFYSERDVSDTYDNYNYTRFQEVEKNNGAGINLKIGGIYRINPKIRVGAAIHSPSILFMKSEIYTTLWSDVSNISNGELDIPTGINGLQINNASFSPAQEFKYTLMTAPKVMGSFAYLIKRKGFISTDIEYVHYPATSFFSSDDADADFKERFKKQVKEDYQGNVNVRVSGERIFDKHIVGRLGLGYVGSPVKTNQQGDTFNFSLGGSYRQQSFYVDVGYRLSYTNSEFTPETIGFDDEYNIESKLYDSQLVATLGLRF